jgi:hypothetical protein
MLLTEICVFLNLSSIIYMFEKLGIFSFLGDALNYVSTLIPALTPV